MPFLHFSTVHTKFCTFREMEHLYQLLTKPWKVNGHKESRDNLSFWRDVFFKDAPTNVPMRLFHQVCVSENVGWSQFHHDSAGLAGAVTLTLSSCFTDCWQKLGTWFLFPGLSCSWCKWTTWKQKGLHLLKDLPKMNCSQSRRLVHNVFNLTLECKLKRASPFKVQGLSYVDVTSPPGPMAATSISSKPIAQAGELAARV